MAYGHVAGQFLSGHVTITQGIQLQVECQCTHAHEDTQSPASTLAPRLAVVCTPELVGYKPHITPDCRCTSLTCGVMPKTGQTLDDNEECASKTQETGRKHSGKTHHMRTRTAASVRANTTEQVPAPRQKQRLVY